MLFYWRLSVLCACQCVPTHNITGSSTVWGTGPSQKTKRRKWSLKSNWHYRIAGVCPEGVPEGSQMLTPIIMGQLNIYIITLLAWHPKRIFVSVYMYCYSNKHGNMLEYKMHNKTGYCNRTFLYWTYPSQIPETAATKFEW